MTVMDDLPCGDDEEDPVAADPELAERQRLFGEKLRSAFQAVADEPTPDVFVDLLDELEAKERGGRA